MSGFVLDASITLAWCFCDEATANSIAILEKLQGEHAVVPVLWALEVGNILVVAERHKRISFAKISEFLELLRNLNIQTDTETSERGFEEIILLAHAEKLTTYDASYLELAMRLGMPLATKDIKLQHAAKRLGVKLL